MVREGGAATRALPVAGPRQGLPACWNGRGKYMWWALVRACPPAGMAGLRGARPPGSGHTCAPCGPPALGQPGGLRNGGPSSGPARLLEWQG